MLVGTPRRGAGTALIVTSGNVRRDTGRYDAYSARSNAVEGSGLLIYIISLAPITHPVTHKQGQVQHK